MRKNLILFSMFLISCLFSGAIAQNVVKGVVIDDVSGKPIEGINLSILGAKVSKTTGSDGKFMFENLPDGNQMLTIQKSKYETQNYPLNFSGSPIDLGEIVMYMSQGYEEQDLSTIVISDDELSDDTSAADNISGLLQASRDVYSRTAAFEWSPSFYRIRGLDSDNAKVLINGVEMNKLQTGRPQWSNWGGLNDATRSQEFSNGLAPSNYTFGGLLGSTNINTRASEYRAGGQISYASSNRSYVHRVMASYASGLLEDGWSFMISGSRRAAQEGFQEGTSYNAYSMFGAIEKKFGNHSLNLTSIYAFNKRGKSAPIDQEVYDIKGIKYNPRWGYQNGKIRNSRIKRIEEPIIMLSHYWDISENTSLNTNVSYQFGELGNSRLDYNGSDVVDGLSIGGRNLNPDPTYYQKLPSFPIYDKIRRGDAVTDYAKSNAYYLLQKFQNNGQLNWNQFYQTNTAGLGYSRYALYEDRNDEKQLTVNTILNTQINDNITLNGKLKYTQFKSENFASMLDLLGGKYYLDVDTYETGENQRQNNILNKNNKVTEGDRFKYNYDLSSNIMNAFLQGQFKFNKLDFYLAVDFKKTTSQRDGLFQSGADKFINNSFGKSKEVSFTDVSGKAGLTYKLTGRHLFDFNGAYVSKAPALRNLFQRESNQIIKDVVSEKVLSFDASYIHRSPIIQARLTGYYTDFENANRTGFFYNQTTGTLSREVITGIEKRHFGAEFGFDAKITSTFKLKGAANIGQYTYNNNPQAEFYLKKIDSRFDNKKYTTYLKNYKLASGPQKAYSIGFEYRDPSYWWVSVTGNYLDDIYINVSPFKRTQLLYDGLEDSEINSRDYDEFSAAYILKQEKFDSYFTLNAVGGKSWKVGNRKYIGFFASVSNILNQEYKTGGYEFSRVTDFKTLKELSKSDTPIFGDKYWFGRGTTYFLNMYYRF